MPVLPFLSRNIYQCEYCIPETSFCTYLVFDCLLSDQLQLMILLALLNAGPPYRQCRVLAIPIINIQADDNANITIGPKDVIIHYGSEVSLLLRI